MHLAEQQWRRRRRQQRRWRGQCFSDNRGQTWHKHTVSLQVIYCAGERVCVSLSPFAHCASEIFLKSGEARGRVWIWVRMPNQSPRRVCSEVNPHGLQEDEDEFCPDVYNTVHEWKVFNCIGKGGCLCLTSTSTRGKEGNVENCCNGNKKYTLSWSHPLSEHVWI